MKKILITTIDIYQKFLSGTIHQIMGVGSACRFTTTCSEYSKKIIAEKGVVVGSYLSVLRILKCQPFYNNSYELNS